jgi:hypothetical protein
MEASKQGELRALDAPDLGADSNDEFTVPVCRLHHRELHRVCVEPYEMPWLEKTNVSVIRQRQLENHYFHHGIAP